ncbi:MAG: DUF1385 domain-containing protein [Anaerolineae bacterium]
MAEFNYGGQAVIEGVMMRGAAHAAIAVRDPKGEIVVHEEVLTSPIYTSRWGKMPFVRGLALLWDALGLGTRALMWSGNVALSEEGQDVQFQGPAAWGTLAVSLAAGIAIFFILPLLAVRFLDTYIASAWVSNTVEGLLRLGILLAYIIAIAQLPDIKRVFMYHGAEHKTINAYEAGAELTPASVKRYSLLHPRCGTGFLLIVMVVSIFVFGFLGRPDFLIRIASRILLIPVIAGIAYEVIRLSAKYYGKYLLVRVIITPSLLLQKLTTREPDLGQIEVAITALQHVLAAEGLPQPTASEDEAQARAAIAA